MYKVHSSNYDVSINGMWYMILAQIIIECMNDHVYIVINLLLYHVTERELS